MFEPNSDDISLLYKRLVILPQDRQEAQVQVDKPATEPEPVQAEDPGEQFNEPQKEQKIEPNIVEKHPFIIIASDNIKDELKQANSNFSKTIGALSYPNCSKYIIGENDVPNSIDQYDCIWTIGLSPTKEQELLSQKHSNILFSPNMEALKSKEEKMAMWTSLKKFASLNSGILSKL